MSSTLEKTQLKPARGNHDRNREYRRPGNLGRKRGRGKVSRTVRQFRSLENRP
jgi:hypothetical protein